MFCVCTVYAAYVVCFSRPLMAKLTGVLRRALTALPLHPSLNRFMGSPRLCSLEELQVTICFIETAPAVPYTPICCHPSKRQLPATLSLRLCHLHAGQQPVLV